MANATDFGSVYMGPIPIGSASVVVVKWLNTPVCNTVRAIKFVVGSNPTYHFMARYQNGYNGVVLKINVLWKQAYEFPSRLFLWRLAQW